VSGDTLIVLNFSWELILKTNLLDHALDQVNTAGIRGMPIHVNDILEMKIAHVLSIFHFPALHPLSNF